MKEFNLFRGLLLFYFLTFFVGLYLLIRPHLSVLFPRFIQTPPAVSLSGGKIALVRINGPIFGDTSRLSIYPNNVDRIAAQLRKLSEDTEIKVVVLRINSPGGSVGAVQEIYRELQLLREKKKLVTSCGDLAASGGYYLAVSADRIYANPGTIIGSIGVVMQFPNVEKLLAKIGVSFFTFKAGRHKDIGSPFRKFSPEEEQIMEKLVTDAHQQFLDVVQKERHISPQQLEQIGDGRIFLASEAQRLGLVDELGNLEEAIQAAADLAGIKGKPTIMEWSASWWESFLGLLESRLPFSHILFANAGLWSSPQLLYLMV